MLKEETIRLCLKHAICDCKNATGEEGVYFSDLKGYIDACGGDEEDFDMAIGFALDKFCEGVTNCKIKK